MESKNDTTNDPVLIWFNGGPGCSSLLGMFQENGPQIVDDNGTLYDNPHPWNSAANVLYIESPAGVGYSIANTTADKSTNDMRQSEDAMVALAYWYSKYPEFATNDLYISGESYGGIYVPYLAW
jgi:carboxypeptidase C (cathepsin A)